MINGITHQVNQGVGEGFDQVFIKVGLFSHQFQVNFFLQAAGEIPDNPGESAKYFLDRLHPGFHDRGLKICCDDVKV